MGKSIVGLAAAAAVLLAAAAWAQAPEAEWVTKTVHGYRFALAVETVLDPGAPGEPRHARAMEHRVLVAVREEASGGAARLSAVSLDVAEEGYQGQSVPLRPLGTGAARLYEARVRLERGLPYRVVVQATPEWGGRTLEARFAYRHHH